ncbi:MAG: HNH endonuclease [bacterium]|nr:HNH endonuclease [bacterium]
MVSSRYIKDPTNSRCQWCGKPGQTDVHHLQRRGSHPELKTVSSNLMDLCRSCHIKATNDHDFALLLQKYGSQNNHRFN